MTAASGIESAIQMLDGRWKLVIMRIVHAQAPPKVEYHLTDRGESLCPALDELLSWAERRPMPQ